jgi:hypothetical protein
MITTNDYSNPVKAEPKKLGIRTSAQLPTPVPDPITRGSDPAKAITTHDLPDPPPRGRMAKLNARRAAMLKSLEPEPEPVPEAAPEDARVVADSMMSALGYTKVEERDIEPEPEPEPKKKAKPKKSA